MNYIKGVLLLISEAANGGALQINCSAPARKLKLALLSSSKAVAI